MGTSVTVGSNASTVSSLDFCHQGIFWVKPYVQMGRDWPESGPELTWFTPFEKKYWRVQFRLLSDKAGGDDWQNLSISRLGKLKPGKISLFQFATTLPDCPGQTVELRVLLNFQVVFITAIELADMKSSRCKIVCFGDFADAQSSGVPIASAVVADDPELVVIAGDIVYEHGRLSEYRNHFFPVINADAVQAEIGAPLLRTRVTVAVAGNHDVAMPKQSESEDVSFGDLFGFFHFWRMPKNGPKLSGKVVRGMAGASRKGNELISQFGTGFVSSSSYSFDWCNTHWTMLDANKYMDWSVPELREWLRKDLMSTGAEWKFVVFHQPGFNSDIKYSTEQRMRLIADILEECRVDIVFSGHCHIYQRHRPFRFRAQTREVQSDGTVPGDFAVDTVFDGVEATSPDGVIYIITGAGGKLVSEEARVSELSDTTDVLVDDRPTYSRLEVDGKTLTFSQVATDGNTVDSFTICKNG